MNYLSGEAKSEQMIFDRKPNTKSQKVQTIDDYGENSEE